MICTVYKNIFDKTPYHITVSKALNRIKDGSSKSAVENIRATMDKERANQLKSNLPSICFSGTFKERKDNLIIAHSGVICLDFDDVEHILDAKAELCANDYIYACWVSPSGKGLKALIKIANTTKHRQHFGALQETFKGIDNSGINEARVCYESYDPDIFINEQAKIFAKTLKVERVSISENEHDTYESFKNLLTWLSNKGNAFVTGERNIFIFKLASGCCRFGLSEEACVRFCTAEFSIGEHSFSRIELQRTVESAYRSNRTKAGTATFSKERLVNRTTMQEEKIEIDPAIFDLEVRPKDVIFGEDVKGEALSIYDNGYEKVLGIDIPLLDDMFKLKKGEITLLSGIGNYGKSSWLKWFLLMRVLLFEEKFALFSPEDNPAQEFYHDCVEILSGQRCTPDNPNRPSKEVYEAYYDFISKHIFYVYPKDISPTPEYIKERFLELKIKEKISGCIIDPFNQMSNNYGSAGGRSDKYLETFLADCSRFAQQNEVYFVIVAHPRSMRKSDDGNYPCPDVFDIADGAMWNNKMDNIIIYHRPEHQTNPASTLCEIHTKKIRRQRVVGKKGFIQFMLHPGFRRFIYEGKDPMSPILNTGMKEVPAHPFGNLTYEAPPF
jgi:VirE-like protein/primase-like protein